MPTPMQPGDPCPYCHHPFDDHQIVMPWVEQAQERQDASLLVGWVQCPADEPEGPCKCFATTCAVPRQLVGRGLSDEVRALMRTMWRQYRGTTEQTHESPGRPGLSACRQPA